MSSLLAVRKSASIELMADAAVYDSRGILRSIESKILTLPEMSAVIAGRGVHGVAQAFADAAGVYCRRFDDVVDSFSGLMKIVEGPGRAAFGGWFSSHEIVIAGWSDRRKGPAVYFAVGHDRALGIEPDRLHEADEIYCAGPLPPWELVVQHGWSDPQSVDDFEADRDGLAIFEAQRLTRENLQTPVSDAEGFSVGGFIELATVVPGSATRRVIRRWPDQIGEPINPFPRTTV